MRTLIASFLLSLVAPLVFAQKPPVKFGDVTKDQIEMRSYDKDTTAAAVILANFGESAITFHQNVGFSLDFERTTRIKNSEK